MSAFTLSLQPTGATWAEERLQLGQANVGTWVLVSIGVLWFQPDLAAWLPDVVAWSVVVAAYIAVQAPFDLLGGYVLPARHGRSGRDLAGWLIDWARGVAVHGGVMLTLGGVALVVGRALGPWMGAGLLGIVGVALVAAQGWIARLLAAVRLRPLEPAERSALVQAGLDPDRAVVADSVDRSFVGGWVGLRGFERLWVPEAWMALPPDVRHVALMRRRFALDSGSRTVGGIGALLFNGLGLVVTLLCLPNAGFDSASALLLVAAGATMWSFVGVLTLPTLSRGAVFQLDRWVADALEDPLRVGRAVRRLDRDQEAESHRGAVVETIFHPVPSPERRAEALQSMSSPAPRVVPWRVARMSLFTSWASLSWLSRAVHCNAGRPELWALLPGD